MENSLSVVPRRAVLVTAGGDGGQEELARALEEPLRAEFGAAPLRIDINDFLSAAGRSSVEGMFRAAQSVGQKFLSGLLGSDPQGDIERAIREVRSRIDADGLAAALGGVSHPQGPSVALCLHPAAAAALGELRRRAKALYPIWAVIGDFHISPLWIDSAIDRYAVAHADLAASLTAAGVAPEQVVVTGIPVRDLVPAKDEKAAKEALGLDPAFPVLLFLAKGQDEETLDRVMFQFSLVKRGASFLLGAGSDQRAAEVLKQRAARYAVRAKLFREATTLGPILDASDVLIAPARGSVAARALTRGTALFSLSPGAAETQNLDFLQGHGAAVRVDSVAQLAAELERWLERTSAESRAKLLGLGRPEAPREVVRAALATAREVDRVLAEARQRDEQRSRATAPREAGPVLAPSAPGFFEEIGGPTPVASSGRGSTGSPKATREALAAIILAENQAAKREEEAKAAAARWERRREIAVKRGEPSLAAEAGAQADRARAEIQKARAEREEAARQRAAISSKEAPPSTSFAELEQKARDEERHWRKMELDDELDDLKRRMHGNSPASPNPAPVAPPDPNKKGPSR
jgi:processive 1,2-diacylglycerol beta-glucosyltransferase